MHQPYRIQPAMPVDSYRTYELRAPVTTHWRKATCAEVDCPAYSNGWRTDVDETSPLGQFQASYIRKESGRGFTEHRDARGMTVFVFEAGHRCFGSDQHVAPLERDPVGLVRDGDWRGNPTGRVRRHTDLIDWRDDFGEHQERIAEQINRG